ncbi:MAG TPA: hypothetical protein VJ770_08435 [Stellaceae bacterium]|nr:hypothetical protein [Stellaceae bacterium]
MNERAVLHLLLFGCVLFGLIIFAEWRGAAPADPTGIALAVPRPAPPAASPSVHAPRLDQLVVTTLARPLFSPTRRPPQDKDGGPGTGNIADMRLTGIVTQPGERLAIFAVTGAKALAVREGEEVSGWRVEDITPGTVLLSGPGGATTLQPKPDTNLVRTVPAAAIVPAPATRPFGSTGIMRPRGPRPAANPAFPRPFRPVPSGARQ